MTEEETPKKITRRDILKLIGVSAVAITAGAILDTTRPWQNYSSEAAWIARPLNLQAQGNEMLQEMLRYATLAPSGHNTQPWKFAVSSDHIRIRPDLERALPVVDPDHRELWISLGCALENLLLAARAFGYAPQVTYPDTNTWIDVALQPGSSIQDALFAAIPQRQNTRSEYDGQELTEKELTQLRTLPLEEGIRLHFFTGQSALAQLVDSVNQGNLAQYADVAFLNELVTWLRFNKKEALSAQDGLFSRCSGNPEVPRWFGKVFVMSTKPTQQAEVDAKKLLSSSGAVIIASNGDSPSEWVRTGQVYERLALLMTSLNIRSSFLNQPIEIAQVRGQVQKLLGDTSLPQLLLRFGHADPMPRSLRRPVESVLEG
jgi:alkylated DNA nucleotide flippase Atl1